MVKIVFLIRSTPFRKLNNYEAMRASTALYDHEVTVAWMGDGVFYLLKTSNKGTTQPLLRLFKDLNISLIVDVEELTRRGFTGQEVIPEVDIVPHAKFIDTLTHSDSVLSF